MGRQDVGLVAAAGVGVLEALAGVLKAPSTVRVAECGWIDSLGLIWRSLAAVGAVGAEEEAIGNQDWQLCLCFLS